MDDNLHGPHGDVGQIASLLMKERLLSETQLSYAQRVKRRTTGHASASKIRSIFHKKSIKGGQYQRMGDLPFPNEPRDVTEGTQQDLDILFLILVLSPARDHILGQVGIALIALYGRIGMAHP